MSIPTRCKSAVVPPQVTGRGRAPSSVDLLLGAGMLVAFLSCYLVFDTNPAIAWSVVTIAAPGAVMVRRFRDNGLLDSLGLFCFAFAAYNGVLLLRLATMDDPTATPYPWTFTQQTYGQVGVLDAVAAVTILFTATIATRLFIGKRAVYRPVVKVTDTSSTAWFYSGVVMYIIGLVMYFLQYQQIGGYFAGFEVGRALHVEEGYSAGLSWPYMAFVMPGLAAIWYAVAGQRRATAGKWVGWVALVLWCGLVLLQGYRLQIIQAVLTVLAVFFVRKRRAFRMKVRVSALLVLAYVALTSFAYLRLLIPPLLIGGMTSAEAQFAVANTPLLEDLKPEHTELAGPYLSLLEIVSRGDGNTLGGASYLEALPAVLPKALYPGTKPRPLAESFSVSIHSGNAPVSGWGFNPVAEAYVNFGVGGIVVIFMLWTLTFYSLDTIRHQAPVGTLLFSVLLPQTIYANRIDFRNVYAAGVYLSLGVALMTFMAKALRNTTANEQ